MLSRGFFAVITIVVFFSAAAGDSSTPASALYLATQKGVSVWVPNLKTWGLMGHNHDYFERGNLDIFTGLAPCVGGPLCRLNVTSDETGAHHGWFCDYVEITSTGPHKECGQSIFYVDQWLATDAPPFELTAALDGCTRKDGPPMQGKTGPFVVAKPRGSASE